jgi:uncharacterized membrane protein
MLRTITTILKNNITVFLTLLFFLLCLVLISVDRAIWFDEAYSLAIIRHSWKEIIQFTTNDFSPPLYYFILKSFSLLFGSDVFVMRMVSVLPSVITMLVVSYFLKKEFGKTASLFFCLSFLASNTGILHSIDIRMYSWALLFVTMTFISGYGVLTTSKFKWYASLFVFTLATFYTHYYASILVACGYFYLFIYTFFRHKRTFLHLIILTILISTLYAPWFFIILNQLSAAKSNYWIPDFTFNSFVVIVGSVFNSGNYLITLIIFLIHLAVFTRAIVKTEKSTKDYYMFGGLLSIVSLLLIGVLLSVLVRPLFISRYMIPGLTLLWMFFATQIRSFKNRTISLSIASFLVFSSLLTAYTIYQTSDRISANGLETFRNYLSDKLSPEDIIVIAPPEKSGHLMGMISYLFPNHTMAITQKDADISENSTLDYKKSPFEMTIITYSEISRFPERKKWLIIPTDSNELKPEQILGSQTVNNAGQFSWSTFQAGYQFDLYYTK